MPDRDKFAEREDKHEVYDHWDGADLSDYFALVAQHGAENVRIENHYYGEGEDRAVEIRVIDKATGELLGSFDMSHPCPPFCP